LPRAENALHTSSLVVRGSLQVRFGFGDSHALATVDRVLELACHVLLMRLVVCQLASAARLVASKPAAAAPDLFGRLRPQLPDLLVEVCLQLVL